MLGAIIHLLRGVHVGFVLAREGGLAFVDPSQLPPHLRFALRIGRLLHSDGVCDEVDLVDALHALRAGATARRSHRFGTRW